MSERFTAYLSERERATLRAIAARENCSENFIVRTALRALLWNKPIPDTFRAGNTSNDNNGERHTHETVG